MRKIGYSSLSGIGDMILEIPKIQDFEGRDDRMARPRNVGVIRAGPLGVRGGLWSAVHRDVFRRELKDELLQGGSGLAIE